MTTSTHSTFSDIYNPCWKAQYVVDMGDWSDTLTTGQPTEPSNIWWLRSPTPATSPFVWYTGGAREDPEPPDQEQFCAYEDKEDDFGAAEDKSLHDFLDTFEVKAGE